MNRNEQQHLLSERSALERMIAETPPDEVIDLRSLRVRLESVNRRLAEGPAEQRPPAGARLTFRGRPVVGSRGIFAEFGMTASKLFTDAVVSLAASYEKKLAPTGPIPNRSQNQLLITRAVSGSFGFELEEYREGDAPTEENSPLADALQHTQELMREAAKGSDDELADAASGQDPRAMAAVREFLKKLVDNEAVCTIDTRGKAFGFCDVGEVRRSLARLGQENLHENRVSYRGAFQGVLPTQRSFEFKTSETGEIIRGKIGLSFQNPEIINRYLNQQVQVTLTATRAGQGRSKYVLEQPPAWEEAESS